MRRVLVLFLCLVVGGAAMAGPFRLRCANRRPSCACEDSRLVVPSAIGPSQEFRPEAIHAPQPWLLTSEAGDIFSPVQDTALEPVPGTGSKLPIGGSILPILGGKENKLNHQVTIGPLMTEETSQRLSRILTVLEWLLWLGGAVFGTTTVGRVLPLAARVVGGLQSAIQAPSYAPGATPGVTSSVPPSVLLAGNPAAPSSIPNQAGS